METKNQKPFLTNYNLLIPKDLWPAHYQILLIILLEDFIKLNANMDVIIKNTKRLELNTKVMSAALNTQILKMS